MINPVAGASAPSGPPSFAYTAAFLAALLAVAAPIILFPVPPLVDYPSHLARQLVLHDLMTQGTLSSIYQLHFAVIPNLGIEAVVLPLLFLGVPVEIAGRMFLVLIVTLLGSGVVRVHRALFGRASFFPLLAFAFVFNPVFLWGFTNFMLGTALALHGFGWWLNARQKPARAVIPILLLWTLALFFSHLMPLVFFLGLILSYETAVTVLRRLSANQQPANFQRTLAMLVVPVVVAAFLYHLAPLSSAPQPMDVHSIAQALAQIRPRLRALPSYLEAYYRPVDILVLLALAGILGLSAWRRHLQVSWPMLLPIGGLLMAYVVGPEKWAGTDLIAYRIPILAMFLFFGGVDVKGDRQSLSLAAAVMAVLVLRTGAVLDAWARANAQYRPMLQAIAALPPQSKIYTGVNYWKSFEPLVRMPWLHFDAYGMLRNRLFVDGVWADPTQNWIVHTPKYAELAKLKLLSNRVDRNKLPRKDSDMFAPVFLANYDFLFAVQANLYQKPLPPGVHVVARSGAATIFSLH